MSILYRLDRQGGFTVGDTETKITAHAYPTSDHAETAMKRPAEVAALMIDQETRRSSSLRQDNGALGDTVRGQDARRLGELEAHREDGSTKTFELPRPGMEDGPARSELSRRLDEDAAAHPMPNAMERANLAQLAEGIGGRIVDWPDQPDTYHGQRDERAEQGRPIEPSARLFERVRAGWAEEGTTVTNHATQERGGLEPGERVFLAPRRSR